MLYFATSFSARISRWLIVLGVVFSTSLAASGQTLAFNPGLAGSIAGGGTDASMSYVGAANGAALGNPQGVAFDKSGNLYFVEATSKLVRVVASGHGAIPALPAIAKPIAGNLYTFAASSFYEPYGLAVDSLGNVFIADRADDAIRVIYASGKIPSISGNPVAGEVYVVAGEPGVSGSNGDQGPALNAQLNQPSGVGVDAKGNIYIADTANNEVRVVYAGGVVAGIPESAAVGVLYTIAGSSQGQCSARAAVSDICGDGSAATEAELNSPNSVALDASGNVYISDAGDSRVRVIYAGGRIAGISGPAIGHIYTVAGTGTPGLGADGVEATTAELSQQIGQIATDPAGDVYIPDSGNNVIRKVDTLGILTTVFGGVSSACAAGADPFGDGCAANVAILKNPTGVAIDSAGNLYAADNGNNLIRVVTANKSAIAFSASAGETASQHLSISNVSNGPLVLSAISLSGPFSQVPATGTGTDCTGSLTLQPGTSCELTLAYSPLDPSTASGSATVTSNAIDAIENENGVTLSGVAAQVITGSDTPSVLAKNLVTQVKGLTPHTQADTETTPVVVPGVPATPGFMATVAGTNVQAPPTPVNGDGGLATSAELIQPMGAAFDSAGDLYIVDAGAAGSTASGYIREVNAQTGNISTIAGGGTVSSAPLQGPATAAYLYDPASVAVDSANNIYIADSLHHTIDMVAGGTISIVAGEFQTPGTAGDGGSAISAQLDDPQGVAVDSSGNIYIADTKNGAVRKIDASSKNMTTIAGVLGSLCGSASAPCGDTGAATSAQFVNPVSVALDSAGNIYVMDAEGFNVAVLSMVYESGTAAACLVELEHPTLFGLSAGATSCSGATSAPTPGHIYSLAGITGTCLNSPCGDGSISINAGFYLPVGITVDGAGNIFIADSGDEAIREVNAQTGNITTVAGNISTFATGYSGIGPVLATTALLNTPQGVTLDTKGNLYIADTTNYVIEAIAGAGTVPQMAQTITFNTLPNVTYGVAPITLTATTDSGLPITYTVTAGSPATVSGSTLTITGAGSVTVTASQAGNTTFAAATAVSQTFTVNPATITVTATNVSQPFGTTLPPSLPFTVQCSCSNGSALVGTDTLAGTPMLTTAYTTTSALGTSFAINIAQGTLAVSPTTSAANYTFVLVPGTLTVGGNGVQTITFPPLPAMIAYGSNPIPLAATSTSGLPVTYTATGSVMVSGSVGTGWSLTVVSAGPGSVTANQAGNSQFAAATAATQAFTVKQAVLTVAATNISQTFGTALPSPLPFTISGLVGSDSTGGTPALSTSYTLTSPVNTTFPINVAQGTLTILSPGLPGNYMFNFVPGTLTVTGAANTITFPVIPNTAYGSSVTLAAKASSGLPVTYTVSGPAVLSGSTLAITGVGPIAVTATQAGNGNFSAATPVVQSFVAGQAVLTVTAVGLSRAAGAANPPFTYQIGGFVNGDANGASVLTGTPLITTPATPASPAGTYPIVPSVGTLMSTNYTFAFVDGVLTVTGAPSYIITASPDSLTIQRGQSAQTTIQVTSVNNYQGSITLSCGQLPIGVTCTFTPATLNLALVSGQLSTGTVLGTLTVNTAGMNGQLQASARKTPETVFAGTVFFLPGGLTGLLLAFNRKRLAKHRKVQSLLILLVLFAGVMGLGACGGGSMSNSAQPGTDTLMITATGAGTSGTGSPNTTNTLNLTVMITQ